MISDWEIWACASKLIEQFGDAAAFHAAARIDELRAASDRDGHGTWLRILQRIEAIAALPSAADRLH